MHRAAAKPDRSHGYVRISAGELDAESLEAQREAIARHCTERGLPAPTVRLEVESAGEEKLERRVELARLIRDARPGDLIVVAALDRWSRDLVYGVQSVRALVRAGVGWYAVREQIDAATPEGDSNLGLRMWLAEEERKRIRGRTVGARERLRGQGLWANGSVPFGYVRGDRERSEHLLLAAHPERAAVVVEWHERLARGDSLRSTAQWLKREHPEAPHVVSGLHKVTQGRVYLGEMRSGGAWIRGRHPPLITLDLWERTQAALRERHTAGRQPTRNVHPDLLLVPLLRCALCGHRCGVSRGRDSDLRYYVCSVRRHPKLYAGEACAGPWVRTDALDDAATEALLARLTELRSDLAGSPAPSRAPDTAAARARIDAALARAVQMATDGAITAAELTTQRARLEAQRAALTSREAAADKAERARTPESRRAVERALRDLARTWSRLTATERREALRLLAVGVAVEADGALRWTWRSAEDLAAER